jgi:hypothetical protein
MQRLGQATLEVLEDFLAASRIAPAPAHFGHVSSPIFPEPPQ